MSVARDMVSEALASQMLEAFDVPDNFRFNGQTFRERCDAWARHAYDQLEQEIEMFEDGETGYGGDETVRGETTDY